MVFVDGVLQNPTNFDPMDGNKVVKFEDPHNYAEAKRIM
jgi:hypothetical protein